MIKVIFDLIYYCPVKKNIIKHKYKQDLLIRENLGKNTVLTFKRKHTRPNVTSPIISKRLSLVINDENTCAKRQC